MMRKHLLLGLVTALVGIAGVSALTQAAADDMRVANAAMKGDRAVVRTLLKEAADVNGAQGDGMTALHWAAMKGDAEMTQMLLVAGANIRATTRLGAYTALFMAAKNGSASTVELLLKAGSDANAKAAGGVTPIMVAAMSGDRTSVRLLIEAGADVNARENENGQTAAIFAASFDRPEVIAELAKNRADLNIASTVKAPFYPGVRELALPPAGAQPAPQPGQLPQQQVRLPNDARGGGNPKGGLTPLMYAARDGGLRAARALVESGAKLDELAGDKSTAVLLAAINGRFDIAKFLVESGADLNILSMDGAGPLYSVVRTQWSRESFYPQPSIKQERTGYLELMELMLDRGADPNARLTKSLWYSSYGYVYAAAAETGSTPFWKCAEVADIEGMKLLLSRGADPAVTNRDGVTALLIASGAGTHGNDDVLSPYGRLAAVKYLVEELHFDVNAADNGTAMRGETLNQTQQQPAQIATPQQQPNPFAGMSASGYTALHNAASRGDNEMILYLVGKGARVDAITRNGVTVVDMANGPRQRVQPYPETVALLEMLGARNSHKCISC